MNGLHGITQIKATNNVRSSIMLQKNSDIWNKKISFIIEWSYAHQWHSSILFLHHHKRIVYNKDKF